MRKVVEVIEWNSKRHKLIVSWNKIQIKIRAGTPSPMKEKVVQALLEVAREYSKVDQSYRGTVHPDRNYIIMTRTKDNKDGTKYDLDI